MSSALEPSEAIGRQEDDARSPPAFLDLADSSARLGSNMPHLSARVELRRMEHERQRALHRQVFEQHMMALTQKQEEELLTIPVDPALQHVAVSAPTTPPRIPPTLGAERQLSHLVTPHERGGMPDGENRKSVTYSLLSQISDEAVDLADHSSKTRPAGAKSMPGSRRPSTGSQNSEELDHFVEGLSIHDRAPGSARLPPHTGLRTADRTQFMVANRTFGDPRFGNSHLSAGHLLDEQLDKEMQNAMLHLPISDDDKMPHHRMDSYSKLSTASAALDLAPLTQTPPRTFSLGRALDAGSKSSEWPQFVDQGSRIERRVATNPVVGSSRPVTGFTKFGGTASASVTPLLPLHPTDTSRRTSPRGLADVLAAPVARSVPVTPLSALPVIRNETKLSLKNPTTPMTAGGPLQSGISPHFSGATSLEGMSPSFDLSTGLSQAGTGFDTPLTFSSIQSGGDPRLPGAPDALYGLTGAADGRFPAYSADGQRSNSGSTALYHHHGSRYGLGVGNPRVGVSDSKMNGLHGPKHKRNDVDREFNRFAGTRLEDLQGEIATMCKDQHGCRYLQKKLEEGIPEHRDLIFKETFGHFAELMTDPFGNYLCQKLLEFSTDEQRTVICDSVAQDLVNISLNMHGTRAVQKMIDFLSVQRQTDIRYDAQIHSIIIALSLHVVVLIKDLNGNHVIQKCLNKLTPEDNQFIYNAVAANCVEVATHRHGCCVLQRCIDHASDHQRVQLVNEITYNALTLVQDPYGNYVVQYILDLNDNRFSDAVIRQFTGNVCALSVQKFSSNVIEKCVRVAEHSTRKILVDEMLHRSRLEKLLRDSYGNYCVQTALDYADPNQRAMLVEGIRPILPMIRNTPYGKRIQSKLQREQLDSPNGHYTAFQPGMHLAGSAPAYGTQHTGHRLRQSSQLHDIYGTHSLYTGNTHSGMHSRQPQQQTQPHPAALHDPYGLQNGSSHHHHISSSSNPAFDNIGGSFTTNAGMSQLQGGFGNGVGLSLSDPYSRSAFPYGL